MIVNFRPYNFSASGYKVMSFVILANLPGNFISVKNKLKIRIKTSLYFGIGPLGLPLVCGYLQGHIQEIAVVEPGLDPQSLHLEELAGVLDLVNEIDQLGQRNIVDLELDDVLVVAIVQGELLRLHGADVLADVLLVGQIFDKGKQGEALFHLIQFGFDILKLLVGLHVLVSNARDLFDLSPLGQDFVLELVVTLQDGIDAEVEKHQEEEHARTNQDPLFAL